MWYVVILRFFFSPIFFSHFFSHFQSSVKNAVHVSLNIFVSKSIALKTAVPVLIHDICSEMFLFFLISQKFTRPLKQQPIPLRSTCPQSEYLQLSTETFTFLVSLFKNLVRFLHRKHSTVCSVLNYTAFSFWANSKATKRYILFFFSSWRLMKNQTHWILSLVLQCFGKSETPNFIRGEQAQSWFW